MTQRLRFVLDGDDHLSPVLNGAGDASTRLHRRLNADMNGNAAAVRQFTRDAGGRLRDLQGRFVSVADASRVMGGGMPGLVRSLGDVSSAGGDAATSLGRSGGGLGGAMIGVAAIAGLSLLPALGALVPMMAGGALAAGTLGLGFAGVGKAMEAAGKGKKEYAEALKKLPKPARDFTKELVGLKKEFSGIGRDIQKAMLPGFTKALKDAGPVIKIVGDGMTKLGGAFGKAAEGAGKLFKDGEFQKDLKANLDMGRQFFGDLMSGLGRLGRSFLDFGAASKPTLTALSGGIRDLLGQGLPGMFDGLKIGIEGSSKFLTGFFNMINTLLPAIGRFSGEVARTFGPLLGELMTGFGERGAGALDFFGKVLRGLMPVFKDLAFGAKGVTDFLRLIGPTVADVGSAIVGTLIPNFNKVEEARGPLQRLHDAISNNKIGILEFARQAGGAFLDITGYAIEMAPHVITGFRYMATGVLTALDGIVSGAATAFGWIPGIGDKIKAANTQFDKFKTGFLNGLSAAETSAKNFAAEAAPRLAAGKLKLDINNWSAQLAEAKRKLSTVPPSKQAALKATIKDLEAKIAEANRQLNSLDGKTATTYIVTHSTTYRSVHDIVGATGGYFTGKAFKYAGGGLISGPGTGTSDDIYAPWLSNGEFVINAASTAKYLPLIEAINQDTLFRPMAGQGAAAQPVLGRPAVAAGGGGTVINVQVDVHDAMDPVAVGREFQRILLGFGRVQGTTVNLKVGG